MPTNTAGALEVVVYQIPVKLSCFPVPRENNVRGPRSGSVGTPRSTFAKFQLRNRRPGTFDPPVTHRGLEAANQFPRGTATWQPMRHGNSQTGNNAPLKHHPSQPSPHSVPTHSMWWRHSTLATLVPKCRDGHVPLPYCYLHSQIRTALPR